MSHIHHELLTRLSLEQGIGPAQIFHIMQRLEVTSHTFPELSSFSRQAIREVFSLSAAQAEKVYAAFHNDNAYEQHQRTCAAQGISLISFFDDAYPSLLRHVYVPPALLWVQGAFLREEVMCAVVGARAARPYAVRATRLLVKQLVDDSICVVSGGARGIDREAHETAIRHGGRTVVVMGCGLSHTYPSEHAFLYEDVREKGGVLVSCFPPHIPPTRGTFPARNRVIAGLSHACIVVQASQKSGALITAQHALEEGRSVGAVPGPIDEAAFYGSNTLLSQGALVVRSSADVIQNTHYEREKDPVLAVKEEEKSPVLQYLSKPLSFDELCRHTRLTPHDLQQELAKLQAQGFITQNMAGQWEKFTSHHNHNRDKRS